MSIEDLINNVMNQDFASAGPTFNEIMQQKIAASLDQEKIKMAGIIFNDQEDIDDEELEDISDDEISDIVDEEEYEE